MTPTHKSTYIALFRGINVGGNNILPMKDLTTIFAKAGCAQVQTYIQSGNVIFSADNDCAGKIEEFIPETISKKFGFHPTLILRTAQELAAAAQSNPFLKTKVDESLLHVGFLTAAPNAKNIATLDPNRSSGDFFHIKGREIFLNLGNGMGKTKYTNSYFDSKLESISTFRNWRTVLKLIELTKTIDGAALQTNAGAKGKPI